MGSTVSGDKTAEASDDFRDEIVSLIPSLRAFARGLCRDRELADDLVQDAMMRAWASRHTYKPGTNCRAWMFTILRNRFYSIVRKKGIKTVFEPEAAERILTQEPTQEDVIHLNDVNEAMAKLPEHQREVLLLIVGAGLSYEEAAEVADCNIGTVKSRLNRGRAAIKDMIDGSPAAKIGI
ncbi:MAG: sigma-70 family RNA polymerase sigma factor [Erythrobacter sp.]